MFTDSSLKALNNKIMQPVLRKRVPIISKTNFIYILIEEYISFVYFQVIV